MPQYEGKPVLTIGKADQAKRLVWEWFDKQGWGDAPAMYKPGHEGAMWALSLEGGPEDWPMLVNDMIGDDLEAIGVFAEPVTSWCLGLYPVADDTANQSDAQLADTYERAVATGNQWAQSTVAAQMAKRLRDR